MMLPNLIVGLPAMLLCLILQVTFTFWSIRYYLRASDRIAATGTLSLIHISEPTRPY